MTWGSLCRKEPQLRALADTCHSLPWGEVCARARRLVDNNKEYDVVLDRLAKVWASAGVQVHRHGRSSGATTTRRSR